ncbi:MAG: hypothetical protein A2167_04285 [Planctomycetes bacterium RBG_13_46_10]|nr:MAG: hypothetical protein A2167_04285 [Planctomycetes bacterium RBG_13_46_10]
MIYPIKKIFCVIFISFICTLFCGKAGAQAALPKTAKLVPPETIVLVDIDNISQLKQQLEKTNFYKLFKEPAMAAAVNDFKTKRQERMRKSKNELSRTIADANVLPEGRITLALVHDNRAKDANEIPLLLISQWGQNITKIKEITAKMAEKAVEDGAHRKSEDFRGVNITTIMPKSSRTINYCLINDCLIGSTNTDALKFVIAHIQGATSSTLADDTDYTATMKTVGPYHDIDFYVNIKQVVKTVLADDSSGESKITAANLGLDNVTSLGAGLGLARGPGDSTVGKALLKINGSKKGIPKIFDVETAALRLPRFISASAFSVASININIKKAYDELYNILTSFSPHYAAITHVPLLPPGEQGEPGLQLKPDIIAHLGSQIIIAQSIKKPNSGTSSTQEKLVAVAIDNRGALEKNMSLLYGKLIIPRNPDARRELLGHTIYLADLSGLIPAFGQGERKPMRDSATPDSPTRRTVAPSQQDMPMLAFTITDTHIVFGSESTVEHAIRAIGSSDTASITTAKWFNVAKSAFASTVGLASFQDMSASGEVLWQKLKEARKNTADKDKDSNINLSIAIGSDSLFPFLAASPVGDLFDPGLLPGFDAVRKYFGISAFYGISTPEGFFFELKYLNPPGSD